MIFNHNSNYKRIEDKLVASELRYRRLFESAKDGILILDAENGRIIDVNQFLIDLLGYSKERFLNKTIWDIGFFRGIVESKEKYIEILKNDYIRYEDLPLRTTSGRSIHVEFVSNVYYEGKMKVVQCNIRDITERNETKEALLFLSYHDQLTGLFNRKYFEKIINTIDSDENLPICLVICDINGLKVANDSFGHAVGDSLLILAANILKDLAMSGEIVARIGGDEFIIICPKTDNHAAESKIGEIKFKAAGIEVSGLSLSLSFGYEIKNSGNQTIMETLANAENHMYRNKLFDESSLRSKTIDVIMQTLFEKSNRESMHSKRVSAICQAIASSMNFISEDIDRIRIAGLVHDIGKIGINENILNKTTSLTDDEWTEMKKHSEIGWRILSTAKEFFYLASYVLSHHERWDGSGYPNGTSQEDIPIEARIITLADAFDAMTSKRSYRNEMSELQAIEEIKRCSGTQFDPKIVAVFINQVVPSGLVTPKYSI